MGTRKKIKAAQTKKAVKAKKGKPKKAKTVKKAAKKASKVARLAKAAPKVVEAALQVEAGKVKAKSARSKSQRQSGVSGPRHGLPIGYCVLHGQPSRHASRNGKADRIQAHA